MMSQDENELLCRTGPGTPMGDLFRRFWLPVVLSRELPKPDCPPVRLRILSEDLIAFRDTNGKVGLLARYCPHRGASLFFGRNEEGGLRCVYHGWKFDVNGACLDMPNEPAVCSFKHKIRQPAYPTREVGGVIWAYMGPPATMPELPQLEWTLVPQSHVYVHKRFQHCNYLQNVEGEVDSSHVSFLHREFRPEKFEAAVAGQVLLARATDSAPKFLVEETEYGLAIGARRNWDSNHYYWRLTQFLMPSFTLIPSEAGAPINFTAAVPVDDTNMVGFTATWLPDRPMNDDDIHTIESWAGAYAEVDPNTFEPVANRANDYLIDREKQRTENFTGMRGIREEDIAVQEDQFGGSITDRTKEHLGTSDAGVIALRRHLLKAVRNLQRGQEPAEPRRPHRYSVHPIAELARRDISFEEVARAAALKTIEMSGAYGRAIG
ncbi:MAG TPA: Rieske 2Fe-2S domain-containing protein [Candidatus Binatia bacterium]|nr:Rieske 2Fe-2S domain-containing protein [Candidatus Binatia bacterium]